MSDPNIQTWPAELLRAVTSSFTLGTLNLSSAPLFLATPTVFAEPLDRRWIATLQSPELEGKEKRDSAGNLLAPSYREIEGRVAGLRGIGGKLRIADPLYVRPQYDEALIESNWSGGRKWSGGRSWVSGLLPPSVTVDAAAVTGAFSVVVRGLPVSIARVLRIGDRFEARPNGIASTFGHYYILTQDCVSDASGKTRLYFEPGLRAGLNAGDQIVLKRPTSVFSCIDDKQGVVSRSGRTGAFGLSLVETLPLDP
jgi:hypothetical protein